MMQTNVSIYLRLLLPFILILCLWIWTIWKKKKRQRTEEKIEPETLIKSGLKKGLMTREMISEINKSNLKKIQSCLKIDNDLTSSMSDKEIRTIEYWTSSELVGIILYAWPSNLWSFRISDGDLEHTSYTHIFLIEVDSEYRRQGIASEMFDEVISETKRISSGVTIYTQDKELAKVCETKLGFSEYSTNKYVHDYDNWR